MNALTILNNPKEIGQVYIGAQPKNDTEAASLVNAMNNPTSRVADHINEEILVSNFFVETVQMENKNKKKPEEPDTVVLPRTVLISPNGESYACTSMGVYNSLTRLVAMFGEPTEWRGSMKFKVKQVTTKNGSMTTLELISTGN